MVLQYPLLGITQYGVVIEVCIGGTCHGCPDCVSLTYFAFLVGANPPRANTTLLGNVVVRIAAQKWWLISCWISLPVSP